MEKKKLPREEWKNNDNYKKQMTYGNIVTRSQTPFVRIKNTTSDMEFFAEGVKHHPSTKPHLMVSMVGQYGALPRMIVTRSVANELLVDKNLLQVVKDYKKLAKKDPLIKELQEYQKENPYILNPNAGVEEVFQKSPAQDEEKSSSYETSGEETSDSVTEEEQSSTGNNTTDSEKSA